MIRPRTKKPSFGRPFRRKFLVSASSDADVDPAKTLWSDVLFGCPPKLDATVFLDAIWKQRNRRTPETYRASVKELCRKARLDIGPIRALDSLSCSGVWSDCNSATRTFV